MNKKELEKLQTEITREMEDKWGEKFARQASFRGNGVYEIAGLYSTDTRELFLMFIALMEEIKMPE